MLWTTGKAHSGPFIALAQGLVVSHLKKEAGMWIGTQFIAFGTELPAEFPTVRPVKKKAVLGAGESCMMFLKEWGVRPSSIQQAIRILLVGGGLCGPAIAL